MFSNKLKIAQQFNRIMELSILNFIWIFIDFFKAQNASKSFPIQDKLLYAKFIDLTICLHLNFTAKFAALLRSFSVV